MNQELAPADAPNLETAPGTPPPERHEELPRLHPSIWVASLLDAEYTVPHGAWISANQPLRGIRADLDQMLAASPVSHSTGAPAERWAIHAHRDFGGYPLGAYEGLERISRIGHGLASHGPVFAAWAAIANEEHLTDFDRAYLGHYDDLHSYLEQLINDLGYDRIIDEAVPPRVRPYVKIDISGTAADLLQGGDLHALPAPNGGVWIFRG